MGIEATIADLGHRKLTLLSTPIEWDSKAASLSTVFRGTLLPAVDISAKIGVARTEISAASGYRTGSASQMGLVTGLGVDYKFDQNWSLRGSYDVYSNFAGSGDRMETASMGLKYRF